MNRFVENIGLQLAGRLIDFGVARITSPHKASPQERIEQIDKTLETLESAPEVRPPIEAPESQNPAALAQSATITTQPAEAAAEKEDVAVACVPCAVGHFSTSAGLLKEAVRFKAEGITSNEVLDRIAMALEEQNTLERVDLRPEEIQSLPPWERALAEEALLQSRQLRHNLENLQSIGQLDRAAADSEGIYKKLFRDWFKQCFAHLGPEKARKIDAEVEARWETPLESNPTSNPTVVRLVGIAPRPPPPWKAVESEEEKLERRRGGLQLGTRLHPPLTLEEQVRIRELRAQGLSLGEIATRTGRSMTSVFNAVHRERPPLIRAITSERLEKVMDLRRKGLTLERIGQEIGVTKQHALYLLHRAGERVDVRKTAEDLQERLLAVNDILRAPATIPKLGDAANKLRDIYDDAELLLQITPRIPYLGPQPYAIGFKAALAEEVLRTGVWCLNRRQRGYETRRVPGVDMREVEIPPKRKELLGMCGESARDAAQGTISDLPGYETKTAQFLWLLNEMMEEAKA